LVKANGRTVRRAAVVGGLVLILALGACENPTSGGGNNAAQEAADTFKSGQSGILDKTTDTVTLNDEAAVNAALTAYEALSAGSKELLTAEKAKLDGLKARIEELKAAAGPAELAAAFKTGHSGVLNKTAETVGLGDEEAVEAALTAYAALNAGTKELLTAEKTKLDALKAKIGELKATANAAAAFRADHAVVLGTAVDTVSLGDETAVNAALTAHEALSSGVKDLLTTEKTTLDTLKAKIDALKLTMFTTVAALQTWLETQTANDADHPYDVAYTGNETPVQIYNALDAGGKFIALDLSAASVTGFATGTEAGRAKIVSLILPDSLTAIPDSANTSTAIFRSFTNLKTVRAANVETIGQTNFRGLTSLTTVILPKATEIKQYAFYGCTGLTTVEVPKVQTIGRSVFSSAGFTTISLPAVTFIGVMVFAGNASLTTVVLGNTPPTLDTLMEVNAMFASAATAGSPKTITFKVPDVSVYTAAGSPWSDKIGANKNVVYYWDNLGFGKDYLTVALEPITP
jgi:hypothetical protein